MKFAIFWGIYLTFVQKLEGVFLEADNNLHRPHSEVKNTHKKKLMYNLFLKKCFLLAFG
jgi:hypothetical protein